MTPLSQLIYIILFLFSVALSAFFSAAETAFMSLQRVRLQHMTDTGVKGAKQVARLLQKPERLLSTILLGDTFANTTAVVLGTAVLSDYLGDHVSAIVTTLLLTGIVLMFGQSIPKTIATRYSEKLTTTFAASIEFAAFVTACTEGIACASIGASVSGPSWMLAHSSSHFRRASSP